MENSIVDIFTKVIEYIESQKFPDIHFVSGKKPYIRDKNWEIEVLNEIQIGEQNWIVPAFSKENIEEIIKYIAEKEGLEKFKTRFELDTSYQHKDEARYRVNCYMDSNWYSMALRLIPTQIPTMESLGLWDWIRKMLNQKKGLILVTGPTGSGKSTNLAAMIDYINNNMKKHIITIEDPIEFAFQSKKCLINQREIWNHTKGFPEAIRASLREDPDIIMVWEMRDPETIKAALTLAETGHLVLSTLHTNDTVQSIDRIVDVFPWWEQGQIRMQLALSLVWIVTQRLVKREDREWRVAAREILVNNDAIKNLIISSKNHQIYSVLEIWEKKWMILMDKYLSILYKKGVISKESLMSYARDKDWLTALLD